MKKKLKELSFFALFALWGLASCSDSKDGYQIGNGGSDDRAITEFKLNGRTAIIDEAELTIKIPVDAKDNLSALAPEVITISKGASVTPAAGAIVDFTDVVYYEVIAESGRKRVYKASVFISDETVAKVLQFVVYDANDNPISLEIDEENSAIFGEVPFGTDITNLKTKVALVGGEIKPALPTPLDLSNPIEFTVVSGNGKNTQKYMIGVGIAENNEAKLKDFSFDGITSARPIVFGKIDDQTTVVVVTVPSGTNFLTAVPKLEISENAIIVGPTNPATEAAWLSGVTYKIISEDAKSIHSYKVLAVTEDFVGYTFMTADFNGLIREARINNTTKKISLRAPKGADLKNIKLNLGLAGAKPIYPKLGMKVDFSESTTDKFFIEDMSGNAVAYDITLSDKPSLVIDNLGTTTVHFTGPWTAVRLELEGDLGEVIDGTIALDFKDSVGKSQMMTVTRTETGGYCTLYGYFFEAGEYSVNLILPYASPIVNGPVYHSKITMTK